MSAGDPGSRGLWPDTTPWRSSRAFRLLFASRTTTALGTQASELHARWATGLMFAAPSVGAFAVTVLSGWMGRVRRHGLAIALAAAGWGLATAGAGLSPDAYLARVHPGRNRKVPGGAGFRRAPGRWGLRFGLFLPSGTT